MTFVAEDVDPAGLERKSPTEAADIDEIMRGMLAIQAQAAAAGKRPLARGTHAKGICVPRRVRSARRPPGCQATRAAERLAQGIFAVPGIYPAIVRFANADGGHRRDRWPDVRAMSFSIDVPPRRRPGRHAPRFFDEQRDHVSDQRRARVRGRRPGALGRGDAREVEGAAIADVERVPQPAARDAARPPAAAGHAAASRTSSFATGARCRSSTAAATPSSTRRSPETIRRGRCRPVRTGCRTSSCATSTRTSR